MPVYRPRRDLIEAVEAALAENGVRLELIVVDDGDETPVDSLLGDFADPRLRMIRVAHGGVSAALNAGMEASTGDYLRFIAADDVCPRDSTATLLRCALAHPGAIAYGALTHCDERLRPRWTMTCGLEGDVLLDCLLGRFTVGIQGLLFPRPSRPPPASGTPRSRCPRTGTGSCAPSSTPPWQGGERASTATAATATPRPPKWRTTTRARGGSSPSSSSAIRTCAAHRPQRQAQALLLARRSRINLTHGRPAAAIAPAIRSALQDPRTLASEVSRSLLAARAMTRQRLAPARRGLPDDGR